MKSDLSEWLGGLLNCPTGGPIIQLLIKTPSGEGIASKIYNLNPGSSYVTLCSKLRGSVQRTMLWINDLASGHLEE